MKMNITNSFFFVLGKGQLNSIRNEPNDPIKLHYESWIYPLDKLSLEIPDPSKPDDAEGIIRLFICELSFF